MRSSGLNHRFQNDVQSAAIVDVGCSAARPSTQMGEIFDFLEPSGMMGWAETRDSILGRSSEAMAWITAAILSTAFTANCGMHPWPDPSERPQAEEERVPGGRGRCHRRPGIP